MRRKKKKSSEGKFLAPTMVLFLFPSNSVSWHVLMEKSPRHGNHEWRDVIPQSI
jgi:hypothetical protein